MRYLVFVGLFALSGCSSPWVRCERHLTPINGARTPSITSPEAGRVDGRVRAAAGDPKRAVPQRSSASNGAMP